MLSLHDQIAIVGGGGGEIGEATALTLSRWGAKVCVADLDGDRASEVSKRIVAEGGTSYGMQLDLCDYEALQETVAGVLSRWGALQIAVNTVGWTDAKPFVEQDDAHWRRIIDVNLMSCVYLSAAVLPHMRSAGYGRIVLTSSLAGRIGRAGRVMYSTAKAGMIGFAKALALEEAPHEITVNCIAPGATDTKLMRAQGERNVELAFASIPRGKFAMPVDQAVGIAFLASREAAHITGQTLAIDGGQTMV